MPLDSITFGGALTILIDPTAKKKEKQSPTFFVIPNFQPQYFSNVLGVLNAQAGVNLPATMDSRPLANITEIIHPLQSKANFMAWKYARNLSL